MITVLGSMNLDVVARVERYPSHGETKLGKGVEMLAGGKGANQAIACGRLGKDVSLIGCAGRDPFGDRLIHSLQKNGVNSEFVKITERASTGTVLVTVDDTAENTMIVIKGANEMLTTQDIDACIGLIRSSSVLLVQMEVPHEVVLYAMTEARKHGVYIILDPAPAEGVTLDMLGFADLITPNKQETKHFTGIDVTDEASAAAAARQLADAGVKNSIIKMAEQGSLIYADGKCTRVKGIRVEAVDTVGAGDSFAGALAVALDDGATITEAVEFATAVSALKVTRSGAQDGIPTRDELDEFCKSRNLTLYNNRP
ncbi:ribokinase [Cohnella sp. REN36]|uniref:ribokinase n=1 Tax=Cohnella sp. REN36 TaxID=2887347 RepID=UPI001D13EDCC|nr:ribokinase [Cohnella sp. REN36]MCC3372510.1 ribokinase [Cohnella sp. REN36]